MNKDSVRGHTWCRMETSQVRNLRRQTTAQCPLTNLDDYKDVYTVITTKSSHKAYVYQFLNVFDDTNLRN